MKKYLLTFLLSIAAFGQMFSQQFMTTYQAGGLNYDWGRDIVSDNNGNIYTVGQFEGTCYFNSQFVTSTGGFDTYIVKYQPDGTVEWATSFGGVIDDYSMAISLDDANNIYVAGSYSISINFTDTIINSAGTTAAIVVKFDPNGNFVWARQFTGNGYDVCYDLKCVNNNVYVTGIFSDTLTVDPSNILMSNGGQDVFVAKLDTSGNVAWARSGGGNNEDISRGVGIDGSDNVYITGSFRNSPTFGAFNMTSYGSRDIFLVKYNSSGTEQWIRQIGGSVSDATSGIDVNSSGDSYVVGRVSTAVNVGTFTNIGYGGALIAKFDINGNFEWISQGYGTNDCIWYDVSVDDFGKAYVIGSFQDTAFFGNDTLLGTGAFVYKGIFGCYSSNGTLHWIKQTTNMGTCLPSGVYLGNDTTLYVTGMYAQINTIGDDTLSWIGSNDIFITTLSCNPQIGIAEEDLNIEINIYPNPTNQYLTIQCNEFENLSASMTILNTLGQVLRKQEIFSSSLTINLANLPSGLYSILFETNVGRLTKKIIKQ
jgi:Secretion system C-terminal sorting domain